MSREEMEQVREWAQEKLRGESEPPWTWYRYMQLVEATTALLEGEMAGVAGLRLVSNPWAEEQE